MEENILYKHEIFINSSNKVINHIVKKAYEKPAEGEEYVVVYSSLVQTFKVVYYTTTDNRWGVQRSVLPTFRQQDVRIIK